MTFVFYIILGFLPGLIWLVFYLRKDIHPEPKEMVIRVFAWGMLITILVAFIECIPFGFNSNQDIKCGLEIAFNKIPVVGPFLYIFIGVALVEEYMKYFVVKVKVLKNPAYDEPIDTMIYFIIAALGFATVENLMVLADSLSESATVASFFQNNTVAFQTLWYRFIGATFLHALASGIFGYWFALTFFTKKRRKLFFSTGLGLATVLHGFFNWFIIKSDNLMNLDYVMLIAVLLILMAIYVSILFIRLKRLSLKRKACYY